MGTTFTASFKHMLMIVGAYIAISCSEKGDIYVEAGAGIYEYNVLRNEITAEQASFAFKVEGGVYRTAGIIHDFDAQRLAARIAARDTVSDIRFVNETFSITIYRAPGKQEAHYAFFVDAGDDQLVFSDIHSLTFRSFQTTTIGIGEDGILTSLYQEGNDTDDGTNVDFQIVLNEPIRSPGALQLTIGQTTVPIKHVTLDRSRGTIYVKIPDDIRAGDYEMVLRYHDEIRYKRQITIPAGRMRKAAQHPKRLRVAHAFFVYQEKLHTGAFISPGFADNSVEYASWDPKTGQWNIHEITDLKEDSWSFNRAYPGGFPDNRGYAIRDKIYFSPAVQSAYDATDDRYYQQVFMSILDPKRYRWEHVNLFEIADDRGDGSYRTHNLQPWNNELYFVLGRANFYDLTGPLTLHKFNPLSQEHQQIGTLELPAGTLNVTLVASSTQMYLLAYSSTGLGLWNQYRLSLYTLHPESGTLNLVSERMTKEQGGYAIVYDGRICIFGGGINSLHGETYDLAQQTWEYINPTYASFGYPMNSSGGFLGVINGKIYNAYGYDRGQNDGVILEWDIDYRK